MSRNAELHMERRRLSDLKPAAYNPRKMLTPSDPDYQKIKRSIDQFGYVDPIIINYDGTIIGGHQRFRVLQDSGCQEADVVVLKLTKPQEKALNVALNKITGEWDADKLKEVIGEIDLSGLDPTLTGFSKSEVKKAIGHVDLPKDWFETHKEWDDSDQEGNEEYNEFLDKFELKKTSDDCYTPKNIYETVAAWVSKEYKREQSSFVRPFFPGGDFETFEYPKDCVVVDNPPFSIMSKIIRFYTEKKIDFFLFAPTLTLFTAPDCDDICYICAGVSVTYENGAGINTSFITNLDDFRVRAVPDLYQELDDANKLNLLELHKELPKYTFPDEVITAAMVSRWAKYGVDFKVDKESSQYIRTLDEQDEAGRGGIYGGAFLISERAAAERAAAERWHLSEREKEIVRSLK